MEKYLKKYNDIMLKYRNGGFGESHCSLYEILSKAGDAKLIDKMCPSELQKLCSDSFGISQHMFGLLLEKKIRELQKMDILEKELQTYCINQYCENGNLSAESLARKLKLAVRYCSSDELPNDVEATLSASDAKEYFGEIKVLNESVQKFSFMHEIIHYFRDVGVGKRVTCTYTRKRQGKTDSEEEQEVNYLTAAAIMPFNEIVKKLDLYENTNDDTVIIQTAEEYSQIKSAVMRRFIEVRKLFDYRELYDRAKA